VSRLLQVMVSLIVALVMVIAAPLVVAGADPTTDQPPAEPVTSQQSPSVINWSQLGLPDELTVQGTAKPQSVTIPLPEGSHPTLLTGQIEAVSNAVNCRVDVFDGDHKYLGPIGLSEDQTAGPFALDLATAATGSTGVQLDFFLRQDGPPADLCTQMTDPSVMRISQAAVTYSGSAVMPTTIADFLPDYLNHVTVKVGPNPSQNVQQSALTLVANLTHLYQPLPIRVDVDVTDGPTPTVQDSLGTSRVIAIREDKKSGIEVLNPGTPEASMLISGEGDSLRRQVELFSDRRFELAQTSTTDVMGVAQFAVKTGTVKTFGELKMTGQATVIGTETLYLGFDASQFGVGSIQSAEVEIIAKYSPVLDGAGSVVLRAGPAVIATQVLDQSGSLQLKARIPADAIQSNVGLGLEVRYVPRQRDMSPAEGILFAIQPESTVQVDPGTQTRRGFSVLPMAFVPEFNVAVNEPDKIRYAAAAINLMGQKTTVALRPRLVTIDDGLKSTTGLLIVTSGEDLARHGLRLPMLGAGDDKAEILGEPATSVDLDGPLGLIETATSDKRTVLAISAVKDWGLVDRSLDYIRSIDGQWGSLNGDVVATGAQGKSLNMTVDQGGGWQDLTPGKGWMHWAWLSIGIAGVLVIAGVVVWLVRWRRIRRDVAPESLP